MGWSLLLVLGPGLVWCGEYIGSGEVILAPRAGAILGLAVLWVPLLAIFSKFWIGLAGAHYTVCTGEGMIDMLSRTPGPKNWVIWLTFIGQIAAGAIASGALANVAGLFAAYFVPLPPFLLGWLITLCVITIAWTGEFSLLKSAMSLLVVLIILGAADVALSTWPGL
jgi:Mn2+/Fe2+ NRAMP family transporter